MNIQELLSLLRAGSSPKQLAMSLLQKNAQGNPIISNILQLAQKGEYGQIEQVARNLAQQRGINFDEALTNFRKTLGL